MPTEPSFLFFSGSGWLVICKVASAMPYDSATGALKAFSSFLVVSIGNGADDDLIKRIFCFVKIFLFSLKSYLILLLLNGIVLQIIFEKEEEESSSKTAKD